MSGVHRSEAWLQEHQRLKEATFKGGPNVGAIDVTPAGSIPVRGNMRRRKPPNKTEAAFGQYLRNWANYAPTFLEFEAVTLRMPGGTLYTPDWFGICKGEFCLWECKGHMREAARVRLKEFAAHFTMFRFFLVRAKDRSLTSWSIQEV